MVSEARQYSASRSRGVDPSSTNRGQSWRKIRRNGALCHAVLNRDTERSAPRASGPGGGPKDPPDQRDLDRDRESGVATRTRSKTARPQRYKVLLYNDDYTPMEFVVSLLEQLFGKSPAAATQIMLAIHRSGLGVAGVFVMEIAETKVAAVHRAAEERGYPLRSGLEKE
jgi:ATP-dependent Clp protease adaptor protein ClpS